MISSRSSRARPRFVRNRARQPDGRRPSPLPKKKRTRSPTKRSRRSPGAGVIVGDGDVMTWPGFWSRLKSQLQTRMQFRSAGTGQKCPVIGKQFAPDATPFEVVPVFLFFRKLAEILLLVASPEA